MNHFSSFFFEFWHKI